MNMYIKKICSLLILSDHNMDMLGPACCAGFVESVVLAVKSCFYHRYC